METTDATPPEGIPKDAGQNKISERRPEGIRPESTLKVRFEARRRDLRITDKIALSPSMLRLELAGDLSGFQSLGFDDHVKLFLPDPLTGRLILPEPNMPPRADEKPLMRDYTPRRFDIAAGRLTLDFALHGDGDSMGPATAWAVNSAIGDPVHIGGPRGSQILPDSFDHYVLIGDETALPAIGRRLEELAAGVRVTVLAEVETVDDRLDLQTRADAEIHWLTRRSASPHALTDAVTALDLSQNAHIWIACEALQARTLRQVVNDKGIHPTAIKASGYWRRGDCAVHDHLD